MMTNGVPEGPIFHHTLSRIMDFFLAHHCFYLFIKKKLPGVPEYAKVQFHMMTLLDVLGKIAWVG